MRRDSRNSMNTNSNIIIRWFYLLYLVKGAKAQAPCDSGADSRQGRGQRSSRLKNPRSVLAVAKRQRSHKIVAPQLTRDGRGDHQLGSSSERHKEKIG